MIYTGITTDPTRRWFQHAAGVGARFTRANPPIRMLFALPQPDHGAALRAEIGLKRLSRQQKLEFAAACSGSGYSGSGSMRFPGCRRRRV